MFENTTIPIFVRGADVIGEFKFEVDAQPHSARIIAEYEISCFSHFDIFYTGNT